MAGTLFIVGLTLFALGSVGLARNAGSRGHSPFLLLLPFASARYVHHYWSDVWVAALVRILGFAFMIAAVAVAIARDPMILEQPERIFGAAPPPALAGSKKAEMNSFVNSAAAIQLAIESDDNERLSGRIHGESFNYDRVELINGMLTARQGSGFLPELELRVLFDQDFSGLERRQTYYVQPGDESLPPVHLSWKDSQGKLQTRIIRSGYRMELQLAPLTRHQFSGFMQIILPDQHESYLSGEFIAYTNRLRYVGDRVDLTFDHRDTLEFVAEKYLQTQYPEGAIESVRFNDTDMKLSRGTGHTMALVRLKNGRLEERRIPLERSHIGWAVRPGGVEITVLTEAGDRAAPARYSETSGTEQGTQDESEPVNKIERRAAAFSELDQYVGERVETVREDGKEQAGILRAISGDKAQVEASLGSGTVQYQVDRDRLVAVRLPQRQLVLEFAGGDAQPEPSDSAASEPAAGTAPEREESSGADAPEALNGAQTPLLERLQGLRGQRVTLVDDQGKQRTGLLKAISDKRVTLTVTMGAGAVDYYYKLSAIRSVEAANQRTR